MWMIRGGLPQSSCRARLTQATAQHAVQHCTRRTFAITSNLPQSSKQGLATKEQEEQEQEPDDNAGHEKGNQEPGAMSRLLEEMTESNLQDGSSSARKAVQEGAFDEDLKQRLLDRIEEDKFRAQHAAAFTEASLPSSAGEGTRQQATAEPWAGTESLADSTLRMLNDSYKPLRQPTKGAGVTRPPKKVDTGRPSKAKGSGTGTGMRLASARDRSSVYTNMRDGSLSEKEREELRAQLRDKLQPGARAMPATLRGLAALANERIEDAIARGQFKNLPRGKKLERDPNMSSPFLDTTEYFMNKIIKKQDIVPPWIEKQQELVTTTTNFRTRLRNDWRRHAARLIASRGGSLEAHIRTAEQYAEAEAIVNPPVKKRETLNTVDNDGHMSQITLTGVLKTSNAAEGDGADTVKITVTENDPNEIGQTPDPVTPITATDSVDTTETNTPVTTVPTSGSNPRIVDGTVFPFRDPAWEEAERAYHKLAIENLNSMTRSYNLMAPNLAKKPYYSLDRELRNCFADVAPQLANEIRARASVPKVKVEVVSETSGGVLEHLTGGTARIYDEVRPQYGFREFWRDLFGSGRTK